MADKSTQLMIDALSRAAVDPQGVALFGSKTEPGLFPPTTSAKIAAQRCVEEGYLSVLRHESRGKATREVCVLTDKGMSYLVRQGCPRQVVEDFLRTLELRETHVGQLVQQATQMADSLRSMRSAVEQILPRLHDQPTTHDATSSNGNGTQTPPLWTAVLAYLAEWHSRLGQSQDCPLPDLYAHLDAAPTIGEFHDCLRLLHDEHQVYLHPWTGPLYQMPQPAFALLIGHEIAYYISRR